jgi:hypothetical protein
VDGNKSTAAILLAGRRGGGETKSPYTEQHREEALRMEIEIEKEKQ